MALAEERLLPAGVFGPRERAPLRLDASILLEELTLSPSYRGTHNTMTGNAVQAAQERGRRTAKPFTVLRESPVIPLLPRPASGIDVSGVVSKSKKLNWVRGGRPGGVHTDMKSLASAVKWRKLKRLSGNLLLSSG